MWYKSDTTREKSNSFKEGEEHQAYGSKREKLTFALKEFCLFMLRATVVIAATRADVGLFVLVTLLNRTVALSLTS